MPRSPPPGRSRRTPCTNAMKRLGRDAAEVTVLADHLTTHWSGDSVVGQAAGGHMRLLECDGLRWGCGPLGMGLRPA